MTLNEAIDEWESKPRRSGCVAATNWLCKRVSGFRPERLGRYTAEGDYFEHVVATDGRIRVDLAPGADRPRDD